MENIELEKQKFIEKIQKEYDAFKEDMLNQAQPNIYDSAFEIAFKSYMVEYLKNERDWINERTIKNLNLIEVPILDYMYDLYSNGNLNYFYDDACDEIMEIIDNDFEALEENE